MAFNDSNDLGTPAECADSADYNVFHEAIKRAYLNL